VEFNVPHHVEFGQEICLVGETEGLGKWEVEQCIPMAWTDGDVWTAKADVPAGSHIQYKYIVRSSESGEVVEWQPCDNLELDVPETEIPSAAPIVVKDAWEGDEHVVQLEGKEEPILAQAAVAEAAEVLPVVSIEEALEEILAAEVPVVPVAEAVLEEVLPEVAAEVPADIIPQVEDVLPAAAAAAAAAAAGVNVSQVDSAAPAKAKKKNTAQPRRK